MNQRNVLSISLVILLLFSCKEKEEKRKWDYFCSFEGRKGVEITMNDSLITGRTYLPVYSQIYQRTGQFTFDLTSTISIRNMNSEERIYISSADYRATDGQRIKEFVKDVIYVEPLETLEIVINEIDKAGGTGGNFLFDWYCPVGSDEPLFEAVMISTTGQQGLSFTTRGIRLK